jgi:ribonuclease E
MAKEMLINVSEGEECRIALLDDGKLEELYMERTSSTSHVGNIYKGRVTNVEPSIQAAFVDFGLGRNGFLHISDLMPSYFGRKGEDFTEAVGRKMARRDRPPIQRCLRRGDDITVQIIKEGIGTKGPTLTTYLSVPGRILVMMPGMSRFGISRKIEDDEERRRLRGILDGLKPIDEVGFIIRTAGVGKTKTEIERDLKYLTRLWENISKKMKQPAPIELYTEGDLVTRTVRDVWTSDIDRIVCDNKDVAKHIKEFFKIAMPRTKNKVDLYEDPIPLFHKAGIEQEIEQMYTRHVPLPSGGSLVIDSTEAIVAIDVNSGKFRDHSDAETTAFKTDMEAAEEIPRQLRLRDLGGVIICDFIDLRYERHRRDLERKLHENLKNDRAKTKVLRMSQFGIIEMTRQRMRPSLKRSIYFDCPHCKGSGLVKTSESMSLDVMRKLAIAVNDQRVARVELAVCPEVALYLLNKKRSALANLESDAKKRIVVRHDNQLGLDEMRLQLFDTREGLVYLEVLGMSPHDQLAPMPVRGGRPGDLRRGGRRDGRGGHSHRPFPQQSDHRRQEQQRSRDEDSERQVEAREDEDREQFEIDGAEEAVDQREQEQAEESSATISEPAPALASSPSESSERKLPPLDEENVIDVDEAVEPIGEAPGAFEDDRDRQGSRGRRGGRRRGRRGRGGRGRGQQDQGPAPRREPQPTQDASEAEPAADDVQENDAAQDEGPEPGNELNPSEDRGEDQPRRRRRRRGGRRHRRRREREGQGTNGDVAVDGPRDDAKSSAPQDEPSNRSDVEDESPPQRTPPPRPAAPPPPVVRTGSTDKHLIHDDVPVNPEPPRRPRTYRDLDAIPDDMD